MEDLEEVPDFRQQRKFLVFQTRCKGLIYSRLHVPGQHQSNGKTSTLKMPLLLMVSSPFHYSQQQKVLSNFISPLLCWVRKWRREPIGIRPHSILQVLGELTLLSEQLHFSHSFLSFAFTATLFLFSDLLQCRCKLQTASKNPGNLNGTGVTGGVMVSGQPDAGYCSSQEWDEVNLQKY